MGPYEADTCAPDPIGIGAEGPTGAMRKKFTPAALNKIPTLLDQGLCAAEIADVIGCTLGTLRVRCSQMGISLRRRKSNGFAAANFRHERAACDATRKAEPK